jgi:hypothetical protein
VLKSCFVNLQSSSVDCFYAYGEGRKASELFPFGDDGIEVSQGLFNRDGIHLADGVVALFNQLLEVAAGDLNRDAVGDDLAGALLLLDPGGAGQSNTHGATVDVEADIHRIGVAGGDGHNVGSPLAVEVFAGPAVGHVEVFVHIVSLSST